MQFTFSNKKFTKKITKALELLPSFLPFILLGGIVVLQGQEYKQSTQKLDRDNYLSQEQEQGRVIDFQQETSALGFDNLLADWSYLNFVQYFGDRPARETIGYDLVPNYFTTISKIDPRFIQAHLNLSVANSMYAGDPEKTIDLMEQVLDTVDPASEGAALLWTSKGLDELLFLGDKDAAIKSYAIAAKWAAIEKSDRPDDLTIKDLAKALEFTDEIELKKTQIVAWSSVLVHIRDDQRSREILDKITGLKSEVVALENQAKQSVQPSN